MEQKGTQELTALVDAVLDTVAVVQAAKADGHIGLEDLPLLLKIGPALKTAATNIAEVPAELKDLSAEEASVLVTHVMGRLAIGDEHAQQVVDKSLKLAVAALDLVKTVKGQ